VIQDPPCCLLPRRLACLRTPTFLHLRSQFHSRLLSLSPLSDLSLFIRSSLSVRPSLSVLSLFIRSKDGFDERARGSLAQRLDGLLQPGRMGRRMDLLQLLDRDLSVNLGRRELDVTEELLDGLGIEI
jgi:hypothetical protein